MKISQNLWSIEFPVGTHEPYPCMVEHSLMLVRTEESFWDVFAWFTTKYREM